MNAKTDRRIQTEGIPYTQWLLQIKKKGQLIVSSKTLQGVKNSYKFNSFLNVNNLALVDIDDSLKLIRVDSKKRETIFK